MAVLALLALPALVRAEDNVIPRELNWTPTPPARALIDAGKLMDLLVKKGIVTPAEQAALTHPPAETSVSLDTKMDRSDGVAFASQP
jgi:hypothetical protein